jgi:hypothetical protein
VIDGQTRNSSDGLKRTDEERTAGFKGVETMARQIQPVTTLQDGKGLGGGLLSKESGRTTASNDMDLLYVNGNSHPSSDVYEN